MTSDMKATLIFPPVVDPRAPHLAIASLAAFLRRAGIEVSLIDLDCAALPYLLHPDRLEHALARLRGSLGARPDRSERRRNLIRLGEHLIPRALDALAALRNPARFFDAHAYAGARDTISAALALHAEAASIGLSVGILPIRYAVDGVDPQRFADLIRVTSSRNANLYAAQWEEELFPALERDRPDLVGISIANSQQMLPGLMLARELRARGHFVVIGGTLFTKFAEQLQGLPEFFDVFADGVVIYEGETALAELFAQLAGHRDFSKVPNYLFRNDDRIVMTGLHVEDVDALPTPDFAGLPLDAYLAPARVLPLFAGKGCYHNRCRFCGIPYSNRISPAPYRVRSVDTIVKDIQALEARFGCTHFVFTDEAMPPRLLLDLAEALSPFEDRGYSFTAYARMEGGFTQDACQRIADMGMRKLFFGLESACQRTLDHMRKGTAASDAPGILAHCRAAGIDFHLFSIIGLPEEEERSARETFAFFEDNRASIDHPGNSFDIHPFVLERRSEYCQRAKDFGIAVVTDAAEDEFAISIPPHGWTNTRGLTRSAMEELLNNEFLPALRRMFSRFHNTETHLWPGAEEYAALYGAHYRHREFPFGTALPDPGDARRFRLCWNPAVAVAHEDGGATILCHHRCFVRTSSAVEKMITSDRYRTLDDLFMEQLGAPAGQNAREREEALRTAIAALIRKGILQLRWEIAGE